MFKNKEEPVAIAEQAEEVKPEFPSDRCSGSGGDSGYSVEARLMFNGACELVGGIPLGPTWTPLHFQQASIGVPKGNVGYGHLPFTDLLPYESAQALRWWFLANANASRSGGTLCVETRLIKHRCEYTFKEIAEEAVEVIGKDD